MKLPLTFVVICWLVLAVTYFATFLVLVSIFFVHADVLMVAYGAAVFALIVSTICAGLIWKSNTISLATKDAILSSVAAALFLMIFLFPGNLLDDYGTTFALILLALGVLIGVVGKQLFTFIVRMIRIEVRASQG